MGKRVVGFWNLITRIRRPKCDAGNVLILLPSCLQSSGCIRKLANSVDECERCGKCSVAGILELAERYGCRTAMATGGRLAMKLARKPEIKAVVAVACEKELQQGLRGVFPKPALGIINIRPNGPCRDTDVELDQVEGAIRYLTSGNRTRH